MSLGVASALAYSASPLAATKPKSSPDAVQAVGAHSQASRVAIAPPRHLAAAQHTGFSASPASHTSFDRGPSLAAAARTATASRPARVGNEGAAHQGGPPPAHTQPAHVQQAHAAPAAAGGAGGAHPAARLAAAMHRALG